MPPCGAMDDFFESRPWKEQYWTPPALDIDLQSSPSLTLSFLTGFHMLCLELILITIGAVFRAYGSLIYHHYGRNNVSWRHYLTKMNRSLVWCHKQIQTVVGYVDSCVGWLLLHTRFDVTTKTMVRVSMGCCPYWNVVCIEIASICMTVVILWLYVEAKQWSRGQILLSWRKSFKDEAFSSQCSGGERYWVLYLCYFMF